MSNDQQETTVIKPGFYYIRAIRKSQIHLGPYYGDAWVCPDCGFADASKGPPRKECYNCGIDLYANDSENASSRIRVYHKDLLIKFEFVDMPEPTT